MLKADLHTHTTYSFDSTMKLEKVIQRCLELGINCLAVADHGTVEGALRLQEIAPFRVIVGQEILTTRGEIMGLFLHQSIPRGLHPLEAASRVKEQGGLVCLPHPFDLVGRWRLPRPIIQELLPYIDVVEVFNSRTLFFWDSTTARRFAQQNGLPASAGSDAHLPWEVGRAYVEMPEFDGTAGFCQALAQGKIVGRYSSPWVQMASVWTRLRRRF